MLNSEVAGKHKLDLKKGVKTVLMTEDKSAVGAAVGPAKSSAGMMSILVDGTVVKN